MMKKRLIPRTGDSSIDAHHEEVFHLTSSLDFAINSGKKTELDKIIKFLEVYVEDHFKEEELLMIKKEFEEYEHHKSEHEKFKASVKELRISFDTNTAPTHIIFKIRKIIDTLTNHIYTVDKKIIHLVEVKNE